MHCQRIEINLGALAGLSLVAIVVLSSKRKGEVSAVCALLRVMSNKELGPRKIRDKGAFREQQEKETPLGRIGKPDDIALAATFLASDDARWITGQVIVAAGGRQMGKCRGSQCHTNNGS